MAKTITHPPPEPTSSDVPIPTAPWGTEVASQGEDGASPNLGGGGGGNPPGGSAPRDGGGFGNPPDGYVGADFPPDGGGYTPLEVDTLGIALFIIGCSMLMYSFFLLFQAAKVQREAKRRDLLVSGAYDGVWLSLLGSVALGTLFLWAILLQFDQQLSGIYSVILLQAREFAILPFLLSLLPGGVAIYKFSLVLSAAESASSQAANPEFLFRSSLMKLGFAVLQVVASFVTISQLFRSW